VSGDPVAQGAQDSDPIDDLEQKMAAAAAAVVALRQERQQATPLPRIEALHTSHLNRLPPPPKNIPAAVKANLPTVRQIRSEALQFRKEARQAKRATTAIIKEAERLPDHVKTQKWLETRTRQLTTAARSPGQLRENLAKISADPRVTQTASGSHITATHPTDADLHADIRTSRFPSQTAKGLSTDLSVTPPRIEDPPGIRPAAKDVAERDAKTHDR